VSARLNANMFPQVYKDLGVSTYDLGCIMLDVHALPVLDLIPGDNSVDDVYWHPDQEAHPYTGGVPAETAAHCTLLYGLMESGQKWKPQVDAVLNGWEYPRLEIEEVSYFPSNLPDQDYSVIIGKLKVSDELQEGHNRLRLLPHVDTFPEYHPHITLAYVKGGEEIRNKWIDALQVGYKGRKFDVIRLNYGDE
jgi:hypothetical protein